MADDDQESSLLGTTAGAAAGGSAAYFGTRALMEHTPESLLAKALKEEEAAGKNHLKNAVEGLRGEILDHANKVAKPGVASAIREAASDAAVREPLATRIGGRLANGIDRVYGVAADAGRGLNNAGKAIVNPYTYSGAADAAFQGVQSGVVKISQAASDVGNAIVDGSRKRGSNAQVRRELKALRQADPEAYAAMRKASEAKKAGLAETIVKPAVTAEAPLGNRTAAPVPSELSHADFVQQTGDGFGKVKNGVESNVRSLNDLGRVGLAEEEIASHVANNTKVLNAGNEVEKKIATRIANTERGVIATALKTDAEGVSKMLRNAKNPVAIVAAVGGVGLGGLLAHNVFKGPKTHVQRLQEQAANQNVPFGGVGGL